MSDRPPDQDDYPPPEEWLIGAPKDRPDRWAHRRGEPRGFALLWSCYLLGACAVTLFRPAFSLSFDLMHIRTSSRMLVAMLCLGVAVVWPMFRLSQTPPRNPTKAALVDVLIVLTPCLAIVGSTSILTRWHWHASGAMLVAVASWTLLVGGAIALATRWEGGAARGLSMLAILGVCAASLAGGLANAWGAAHAGAPLDAEGWRVALLLSPFGAPFAISSHPSPAGPYPDDLAWRLVLLPLAPALALWLLAGIADALRAASGRGPRRPSSPRRPRRPRPDRAVYGYS